MMSPGPGRIDFFTLVTMHSNNAAEAFFAAGTLVDISATLLDRALVGPHESQLAKRIVDDLEGHADKRSGRVWLQVDLLFFVVWITTKDLTLEWTRQVAHHGIQQRLNPLFLNAVPM